MPFEPGHKRIPGSGRRKGQVSPRTKALEILLLEHQYNPVKELLKLLPKLDERDAAKVHLELMQYIYPKRRDNGPEDSADTTPERAAEEAIEHIRKNFPQLLKAADE